MKSMLNAKKVAILVADGFEQLELTGPKKALEQAGAETRIGVTRQGHGAGLERFRPRRMLELFAEGLHGR